VTEGATSSKGVWALVDAVVREEYPELVLEALRARVRPDAEPLDEHDVCNLLDDMRSAIPLDDACRALARIGVMDPVREQVEIGRRTFTHNDVRLSFEPPTNSAVDPAALNEVLRLAGVWSSTIAALCDDLGVDGVPQFWATEASDERAYEPLVPDAGSMATADLLSLWALLAADPLHELPSYIERLTRLLISRVDSDGVLISDHFDDDFVYNFDPARGSHTSVDAAGNTCSALTAMAGVLPDHALAVEARLAAARLVAFLVGMQNHDGSWSIYRDPTGTANFPPRGMSIRFAVFGISDALDADILGQEERRSAKASLDRAAGFLLSSLNETATGWSDSFRSDSSDGLGLATAVLLEPIARLGDRVPSDVTVSAADRLFGFFDAQWPDHFRIEFRVPTWSGPSSDKLSWELPANGVILGGLLRCPRSAQDAGTIGAFAQEIVESGQDGFWRDILMAKSGASRASVSNTLLQVRALAAWRSQTISDLSV
jgi:hypothetical protein